MEPTWPQVVLARWWRADGAAETRPSASDSVRVGLRREFIVASGKETCCFGVWFEMIEDVVNWFCR